MSVLRKLSLRKDPSQGQNYDGRRGSEKEAADLNAFVNSQEEPHTPDSPSCGHDFSKHKIGHLRFIASTFTEYPAKDTSHTSCPIYECESVFPTREEMCRHLPDCEHLSKGHYYCLLCQKRERVARFHCKRCPSRSPSIAKRLCKLTRIGPKTSPGDMQSLPSQSYTQPNFGSEDTSDLQYSPYARFSIHELCDTDAKSKSSVTKPHFVSELPEHTASIDENQDPLGPMELPNSEIWRDLLGYELIEKAIQPEENWYQLPGIGYDQSKDHRQAHVDKLRGPLTPLNTQSTNLWKSYQQLPEEDDSQRPVPVLSNGNYTSSQDSSPQNYRQMSNMSTSSTNSENGTQSSSSWGFGATNSSWGCSISSIDVSQRANSEMSNKPEGYSNEPISQQGPDVAIFSNSLSDSPTEMQANDFPGGFGARGMTQLIPDNSGPSMTNKSLGFAKASENPLYFNPFLPSHAWISADRSQPSVSYPPTTCNVFDAAEIVLPVLSDLRRSIPREGGNDNFCSTQNYNFKLKARSRASPNHYDLVSGMSTSQRSSAFFSREAPRDLLQDRETRNQSANTYPKPIRYRNPKPICTTVSSAPPHLEQLFSPLKSPISSDIGLKLCCECGFEPQGDERWKPSNLTRHKKTHEPTSHYCPYPGCGKSYTRIDNLNSHRKGKGHVFHQQNKKRRIDSVEGE